MRRRDEIPLGRTECRWFRLGVKGYMTAVLCRVSGLDNGGWVHYNSKLLRRVHTLGFKVRFDE